MAAQRLELFPPPKVSGEIFCDFRASRLRKIISFVTILPESRGQEVKGERFDEMGAERHLEREAKQHPVI